MIPGRLRVSAGAAKKRFAFAALFCAAALPAAAQEIDRELVYDGGERPWLGTWPWVYYNWSGNIAGFYHFGSEDFNLIQISEETWRYVFREDHQGTVKILFTVSPGEIVVESGDYVFAPAGWEDNGLLNQSVDGSIKGSGDLIVNAGASLARALFDVGRRDKAFLVLERALGMYPDHPLLIEHLADFALRSRDAAAFVKYAPRLENSRRPPFDFLQECLAFARSDALIFFPERANVIAALERMVDA